MRALASARGAPDDALVISEAQGLAADERGVLLGLLLTAPHRGDAGPHLVGPGAERCLAAVAAARALAPGEAVATRDALAAELAASWPVGLRLAHAGWLRRVLERETAEVIRAVTLGAPDEVRHVADEILGARGEVEGRVLDGPAVAELRRAIFAPLAALLPSAAGPPEARHLGALPFAELLDEIDRRGATTLGLALAGAPDGTVARAAAGAGEPFARLVLAAARSAGASEARAEARALVAAVPAAEAARGAVRALGLRAVARDLAPEGEAALAAVALRLPPFVGDALLACASDAAALDGEPGEA
jgi:hypothetical protein